jgi:hypothetical protein
MIEKEIEIVLGRFLDCSKSFTVEDVVRELSCECPVLVARSHIARLFEEGHMKGYTRIKSAEGWVYCEEEEPTGLLEFLKGGGDA